MSNEAILSDLQTLAEMFKAGGWKELRVEFPGGALLLSEDLGTPSLLAETVAPMATAVAPVAAVAAAAPSAPAAAVAVSPAATVAPAAATGGPVDPSWTAIRAPNLGTFYRSPKPGTPPFVEVGQRVTAETEICLLEVMKLFTSVKAGNNGVIKQVCVDDAQLVEGDTILFYIAAD